jgi:hypothetical protein
MMLGCVRMIHADRERYTQPSEALYDTKRHES